MLKGSFVCVKPKNNSYLYLLTLLDNNTPCFKGFGITQLITSRHGAKYTTQCNKDASGLRVHEQAETFILFSNVSDL
jgi:hypothetical protein